MFERVASLAGLAVNYKKHIQWELLAYQYASCGRRRNAKLKYRQFIEFEEGEIADERLTPEEVKSRFDEDTEGFHPLRKRVLWDFFYEGKSHDEILAETPGLELLDLEIIVAAKRPDRRPRSTEPYRQRPKFASVAEFETYTAGMVDQQRKQFLRLHCLDGVPVAEIAKQHHLHPKTVTAIILGPKPGCYPSGRKIATA